MIQVGIYLAWTNIDKYSLLENLYYDTDFMGKEQRG